MPDMPAPMITNFGTDVCQSAGYVAGQVLKRLEVDLFIERFRPCYGAVGGGIRDAVGDNHDIDGRQHQIALLGDSGHFREERIEIGHPVCGRKPLTELGLDVRDVFVFEIMDRMKTLGFTQILSTDAGDEHRLGRIETPEGMQMTVDVMGEKQERIIVVAGVLE